MKCLNSHLRNSIRLLSVKTFWYSCQFNCKYVTESSFKKVYFFFTCWLWNTPNLFMLHFQLFHCICIINKRVPLVSLCFTSRRSTSFSEIYAKNKKNWCSFFPKMLIFWILFRRCPFFMSTWTHCPQWGFSQFPQTNSLVVESFHFIVSPCVAYFVAQEACIRWHIPWHMSCPRELCRKFAVLYITLPWTLFNIHCSLLSYHSPYIFHHYYLLQINRRYISSCYKPQRPVGRVEV
jgi:hypothetical protein